MYKLNKALPTGFAFDAREHIYSVNGRVIPGVTSLLDRAGKVKGKEFFTEYARERGIAVHATIEQELTRTLNEPALDAGLRPYLDGFRAFRKLYSVVPLYIEQLLYWSSGGGFRGEADPGKEYAGRSDLICIYNGRVCVVDFKTENRPEWAGLQLAAYAGAVRRMGLPCENILSVCLLDRSPYYTVKPYSLAIEWAEWCDVLHTVAA